MPFPKESDVARALDATVKLLFQCNRSDLPGLAFAIQEAARRRDEIDGELTSRLAFERQRREGERAKVGKFFRRSSAAFMLDAKMISYSAVPGVSEAGYATGWAFQQTSTGDITVSPSGHDASPEYAFSASVGV